MFCLWALSALLLQATATLTAASSSNCTDAVHYDTISMFSHAPLTFSYEVPDDAACAAKCGRIATCRAWLYSTSGQECQLYRDNPVSQAQSPHFVSGSCDTFSGSSGGVSTSVLAAPSQSLIPQQPEPSHHAKRERSHRHSHHGHGHSH
ncbi:uncharacterized protein N7479_004902 [Penicillium vulpinum]|nr:uncharacterized protein N7479_004902 [Penicillium vulpinum]KAJ5965026.1 hypothetical protein N7479_004902 [Penicillium vulpinum]